MAENSLLIGGYLVLKATEGQYSKLPVPVQPNIGLDIEIRQSVLKILNSILADEAVLGMKTRNAHWNACGTGFLEQHTLLSSQYKQLNDITDRIAERSRMLGGTTPGSFGEFLLISQLDEIPGEVVDINNLLADQEATIRFLREATMKCSEECTDEGTNDLLVEILRMHEKMAWMLRSYI